MRTARTLSACSLLALSLAATDAQAARLRYAVVLEESLTGVAGAPESASRDSVQGALGQALLAEGAVLVDADQTRALRAALGKGIQGSGGIGPVTASDADLLVAGGVRGSFSRPMGLSVFGCQLSAQLRVIAVDSGEVVGAVSAEAIGRDFAADQAYFQAASDLGKALARKLLAIKPRAETRLELAVATGQPANVKLLERILRVAESLDGVVETRVLNATEAEARIELVVDGADTRSLALSLAERPETGLFVWGYSSRVLKARLRVGQALRLDVIPTQFVGRSKEMARLLPTALASGLTVEGSAGAGGELIELKGRRARRNLLRTLRKGATKGRVLLEGSHKMTGDRLSVTAQLTKVSDGKLIARGASVCAAAGLTKCMSELAAKMRASTLSALQSGLATDPSSGVTARPLRVVSMSMTDLFPARAARLIRPPRELPDGKKRAPADWIEIANDGDEPLTDIRVTAEVPRFTSGELPLAVDKLMPGATARVPLKLILDLHALRSHDENLTALARVKLKYEAGEFLLTDVVRMPITIYHRNALTWAESGLVASFVTATTDNIQAVARGLIRGLDVSDVTTVPMALFEGLRRQSYIPDPVNPYAAQTVDYVQYPVQTLERRSGDCDDLAVLYAALAEAVGLRTLLLTTPGHIFVAVPTDRPAQTGRTGIHTPNAMLMEHEGRLWLPLETSAVTGDFAQAWALGAKRVRRATGSGELGIIDVRRSWSEHPPIDLSPVPQVATEPFSAGQSPKAKWASVEARFEEELVKMLDSTDFSVAKTPRDPEAINRRGIALVALGRLGDARSAFQKSLELGASGPGPANNLGNLVLLGGEAEEALRHYEDALGRARNESRHRIVVNRLLAAWVLEPSGERFLELVLGANEAELRDFYDGINGGPLRSEPAFQDDVNDGASLPVDRLIHWL